ncbi:MAG: RNA methyltransferase [Pseudomonadota bacterium]
MSDQTAPPSDPADPPAEIRGPAMILVEPQLGQNIGAAARAMWNFGLADLRLVAPRDGWPNEDAVAMASGASHVLERVSVHADRPAATADFQAVYATTARPRELTKQVFTPAGAVADIASRMARGERCGILFGRERTGLENEDVVAADAIVAVPTNPDFASLNLAQCVLLMSYEWRRATVEHAEAAYEIGRGRRGGAGLGETPEMATHAEVARLAAHLEQALDAANYFWPEHKRPAMAASLRNLLARAPLTNQDARMLHGVVRALAEGRKGGPAPGRGNEGRDQGQEQDPDQGREHD